jgi:hypothetical protein
LEGLVEGIRGFGEVSRHVLVGWLVCL